MPRVIKKKKKFELTTVFNGPTDAFWASKRVEWLLKFGELLRMALHPLPERLLQGYLADKKQPIQGYLAHKKPPPPSQLPRMARHPLPKRLLSGR